MTKQQTETEAPDVLVPDSQVRGEMGGISEMTMCRWDRDPRMAAAGWPPAVKIRGHKFRSRKQLEIFKHNKLIEALTQRSEQPPLKTTRRAKREHLK